MGEYIERKKAIDAIVKAVGTGFAVTAEDLAGILDDLPATDVAPVVHAHWKMTDDGAAYCTSCKRKMAPVCYGYAYCPRCGAEMDGQKP